MPPAEPALQQQQQDIAQQAQPAQQQQQHYQTFEQAVMNWLAGLGQGQQRLIETLASLTAGNIAATGGMAKLLRENEFTTQYHEGENANIHIQLVDNRVILVVIFDNQTSLGLVRLRVKKACEQLSKIFEQLMNKVAEPGHDTPFAEITDDDIDNLFSD